MEYLKISGLFDSRKCGSKDDYSYHVNGAILDIVPLCSIQHELPYMTALPRHRVIMISLGEGPKSLGGKTPDVSILHSHLSHAQLPLLPLSPLAGDNKFGSVYLHAVLGPGPASWADTP